MSPPSSEPHPEPPRNVLNFAVVSALLGEVSSKTCKLRENPLLSTPPRSWDSTQRIDLINLRQVGVGGSESCGYNGHIGRCRKVHLLEGRVGAKPCAALRCKDQQYLHEAASCSEESLPCAKLSRRDDGSLLALGDHLFLQSLQGSFLVIALCRRHKWPPPGLKVWLAMLREVSQ